MVIFIIDTLEIGGAEKSLLAITSRFRFYQPVFIQLFAGGTLKFQFEKNGIEVITLNLKPDYDFKYMAQKVKEAIHTFDVQLIHSTLFRSDQVARIVAKELNIPLINSLVNNSYAKVRYNKMSFIQRLKLKYIEYMDRRSARSVNLFISNSNAIKKSNALALNIPKDKIKVIFRGRELDYFVKIDNLNSLKKEFSLTKEKIFLNVSRLLDRKGQLELIEAFYQYTQINTNAILLIAGEGQYRLILEQKIEDLKLHSKVKLLGNRSDVAKLLQLADYFIFSSHYEGLPGSLIEAMMSRLPIIASDIPENLECVDAENSLIFKVGDAAALTEAMINAQHIDWSEKIEMAFRFASNNFDIDKIASEYELSYQELLRSVK